MVYFSGRLRGGWEHILPQFHAVDIVDGTVDPRASGRHYELSWFGVTLNYVRPVDRPALPARAVEPWIWLDQLFELFRRGF